MGSTIGQQVLQNVGFSNDLSADGRPRMKAGGVTIDWPGTVSAVGADLTLPNGIVIPSGEKYLRAGQVVCRITATAEVQTITVTGTPTGGSFTVQGQNPDSGAFGTAVVPFNSTAAAAQALLDAIFGVGNTTVGGGALPGAALTVTFAGRFGDVPLMTVAANNLTGGSTPAAAIATTTPPSTNVGQWGPYDPSATDGRQNLNRGDCYLVRRTWREVEIHSNHPPVMDGGLVWKQMLLMTTGTASLAAGPTQANLLAAFPAIGLVDF